MEKSFTGKLSGFFGNKWTKLGFSLVSAGYLWFLGWIAWLTFAYHMVFENAAAVFFLYAFINVFAAIVMIYTRRSLLTKLVALFMHPLILVMLVYGFGNWYLLIPPFVAATVVFFASGASESLKVILGTIYMILFVLAVLAYITLQTLTIRIPFKEDLHLRTYPQVAVDYSPALIPEGESPPFRLIAYVDDESRGANRVARYFVERTDLDIELWNVRCERVFGGVHVRTFQYERELELKWFAPDKLILDGQLFEIDETGKLIVADNRNPNGETGLVTTPPIGTTAAETPEETAE